MKIAITGAGGFLGTEILHQLADCIDVQVLVVTGKPSVPAAELFDEGRLQVSKPADILADPSLMERCDVLLNCAFPRNVDGAALAKGLRFIAGVFRAAREANVGAIVNVSSQSVYSQRRTEPAAEQTPLCLESKYAVAKYASELLLEAHCGSMPRTNVRMASLIGPGFDQRVVNKMVAKALANEKIEVQDNGSRFGFLDVADAAAGIIALVRSDPETWRAAYNLGPDGCVTLGEIAASAVEAAKAVGVQVHDPLVTESDAEPVRSELDSTLFRQDFGWEPAMTLQESAAAIAWTLNGGTGKAERLHCRQGAAGRGARED